MPKGEKTLNDFFTMSPTQRSAVLLKAIDDCHAWHYERNRAYRRFAESRGIGATVETGELARLLRPTAQVFKSYIDLLGTPFPQDKPRSFLDWLASNLSIALPRDRFDRLRDRYPSFEALLQDIEAMFSDLGLEVVTSSGTSGRFTVMVRDRAAIERAVESYTLSTYRQWGIEKDHRLIFVMPRQTRVQMARAARAGTEQLGLAEQSHYTIPFDATPDRIRIRTGRTFRPGLAGWIERQMLHPVMKWMGEHHVQARFVTETVQLLERAAEAEEKILLLGGLVQLHAVCGGLRERGHGDDHPLYLAPGSLIATGGGMKEEYPLTPAQIRQDLQTTITIGDGRSIPVCDVYGMAEANWAAVQCAMENYHIPPWVYPVALNDDDEIITGPDVTGLLGFFDPCGGGDLFPAFFKTADRVRLFNGDGNDDPAYHCPCGADTSHLAKESIQRVDLLEEAGCAGQF